jgi:hypothetical protein
VLPIAWGYLISRLARKPIERVTVD